MMIGVIELLIWRRTVKIAQSHFTPLQMASAISLSANVEVLADEISGVN